MPIWRSFFHLWRARAVVVHPVDAKRRVKLRSKAGGEKAVAEEPA